MNEYVKFMRILHIGNTAGVGSVIAKWQKKILNWKTTLITRKKLDPYHLTTYGYALPLDKFTYTIVALLLSLRHDIIHIHDFDKIVPIMRKLPILKNKTIVLHYHGSRIRNNWKKRKKFWVKADVILVSTKDLLDKAPEHVKYLPNPIDTDIFKVYKEVKKRKKVALYVYAHYPMEHLEWPKKVAKNFGLKLYIHDRKRKPIPHKKLPLLLNLFEFLIDRNYIPSLSKTALEALACGLKVIRWDEKIIDKLPNTHKPTYVIRKLATIYFKKLKVKGETHH